MSDIGLYFPIYQQFLFFNMWQKDKVIIWNMLFLIQQILLYFPSTIC